MIKEGIENAFPRLVSEEDIKDLTIGQLQKLTELVIQAVKFKDKDGALANEESRRTNAAMKERYALFLEWTTGEKKIFDARLRKQSDLNATNYLIR